MYIYSANCTIDLFDGGWQLSQRQETLDNAATPAIRTRQIKPKSDRLSFLAAPGSMLPGSYPSRSASVIIKAELSSKANRFFAAMNPGLLEMGKVNGYVIPVSIIR
nr:hypothetical protein Iba_chr13eCG11030 [Ipomoea batatas]